MSDATLSAPSVTHALPDLRLGLVPLSDAAPLLVAEAKGMFRRHGLRVALGVAPSWSALRDRVAFGVWDGAHMLGPMPLAAAAGLGGVRAELCVTATLGRNGNTMVLGGALQAALAGAAFPLAPGDFAAALAGRPAVPRLAVVFPYSSHNYLLRHWLAAGGIDPDRDVELVVLPPPDLPEALASGAIDGFCAGEPWGSRAVELRVGRIVLTTGAIWADHPEKVLALPVSLVARDPARVVAATAAVIEAAAWLAQTENRAEAAHILHAELLASVPLDVIALALNGQLRRAPDGAPLPAPHAIRHGAAETFPDPDHAAWFAAEMHRWGHLAEAPPPGIWRPDLWRLAADAAGFAGLIPFATPLPSPSRSFAP